MRALLPSRRRSRVLGAALAALALVLAWPMPARAATTTIEVANTEDGAFTPAEVSVEAGDTVTWEWTANEPHRVRFPEHPDVPTDDSGCFPNPLTGASCTGHTYKVRFDEVGTYPFRDDVTGSEGVVEVTERTSAPPKPTPTPDPTPDPTTDPEPSETSEPEPEPTSEPEPSPTPTSEPEPDPSPEPAPTTAERPPPPRPTAGTAAPPPVDAESPSPTEASPDEPTVAGAASPSPVPEPTFEDFPEAADPTPGQDVDGEVALDLRDDGGDDTSRTVWGVVGGVTLLGTLGAFGRRVLFADAWD